MSTSTNVPADSVPGFKDCMRAQWNSAAAGWDAHTPDIRRWLAGPTEAMCRMAGVRMGARVLDVAAGSGDQSLDIARQVGASGHVLATDLSPAIARLARDNAARAGLPQIEV